MALKDKPIIKASGAIQTANTGTSIQRLAWNILLANSFDDLLDKDEHCVSVSELMDCIDFKSRNIEHLKNALRGLVCLTIEWNILGKDGREWGVASLLSHCRIVNGKCFYGFPKPVVENLATPEMYAKISMIVQSKLAKNKSAIALYELCVDYCDSKRGFGESPWISLEDFKKLLGIKINAYPEFKIFRRAVLNTAVKLVNKNTPLHVKIESKKDGRKIAFLKLKVLRNEAFKALSDKSKVKGAVQSKLPLPEFELEDIENKELFERMRSGIFGIDMQTCIDLIKKHDEFYLLEKMDYTQTQYEAGKIKTSVSGFLLKAINQDWQTKNPIEEDKKRKKNENDKRIADAQNKIIEEEKRKQKIRNKNLSFFETLPEFSDLHKEFKEKVRLTGRDEFLKNGAENPLFKAGLESEILQYISEKYPEKFEK